MDKRALILYVAFLISLATANAYSENFPPNIGELVDDYYDVFGEPLLSASVIGTPEFESGETSTIFIQLVNDGQVTGFETDNIPSTPNESMDARTELHLEYDVTTAINIQGTLKNNNGAPIRILSGCQQAGFLRSGETSQPMEFGIGIFNNAPSGTYELSLNLTYQYQYDVKVEGYPEQDPDYWYMTRNQTLPILITVKPEADFEIVDVRSHLMPDRKGVVYITYKNIGSDVAENAVARIIVDDPFSTTDDEAFLGTLYTGDSYEAQYTIEVDNDALHKTYVIDTDVQYRDRYGDTRITDIMKAPAMVTEPPSLLETMGLRHYLAVIACVGAAGVAGIAGIAVIFSGMKRGDKNAK